MRTSILLLGLLLTACAASPTEDPPQERTIQYRDNAGPGRGKHIVLIAAEPEYRSEEALPMLAQLLAKRHGFDCTVLFAQDPLTGVVDPEERQTIVGLEWLDQADLVVIFTRYCTWKVEEMRHLDAYLRRSQPVIGIRTATHAFAAAPDGPGKFDNYAWDATIPPGGFGSVVLGTTWLDHLGVHGEQSTRGIPVESDHPILNGVGPIWGPTDVYAIETLPDDAQVLVRGEVLEGLTPDSPRAAGDRFAENLPVAWTREVDRGTEHKMRIFTTTMGSARDFQDANLRRLFVNACYWAVRIEDRITPDSTVEPVEWYEPSPSGFGLYLRDHQPVEMRRASRGVHRW